MNDILKTIGTLLTISFGPLATRRAPALAPDLETSAWWLSVIASFGAFSLATALLHRPRTATMASRHLKRSFVLFIGSAVVYIFINLFWTVETDGWPDEILKALIVIAYATFFGSLTYGAVAWQKLTKTS